MQKKPLVKKNLFSPEWFTIYVTFGERFPSLASAKNFENIPAVCDGFSLKIFHRNK